VELYTSEGCDSCPPAERWLRATFPARTTASERAAVLAFHVDYWNQLGWTDRFAQHEFTLRQQDRVHAAGGRTVYTPQLLLQGRDVGLWRSADVAGVLRRIGAEPARASIELAVRTASSAVLVDVKAAVDAGRTQPVAYVALTESDLSSSVTSGENAGAQLVHTHVVRALSRPVRFDAGGHAAASVSLPLPRERGRHSTVIGFVEEPTGGVLQAVVLPVCDGS
jgi:hypothetical protein